MAARKNKPIFFPTEMEETPKAFDFEFEDKNLNCFQKMAQATNEKSGIQAYEAYEAYKAFWNGQLFWKMASLLEMVSTLGYTGLTGVNVHHLRTQV